MSDSTPPGVADDRPDTIDIIHSKAEDYRKVHANGSRGGLQPRSDFRMDLILDYRADPERESFEVLEDGSTADEPKSIEGEDAIIREKQVGVMMSPNHAFSVGAWMLAQLLEDAEEQDILDLVLEHYDPINLEPPGEPHD